MLWASVVFSFLLGLEGGSDYFTDQSSRPNTFVRQSAEGEVFISPVPGDGGGGGDGSSAPGRQVNIIFTISSYKKGNFTI